MKLVTHSFSSLQKRKKKERDPNRAGGKKEKKLNFVLIEGERGKKKRVAKGKRTGQSASWRKKGERERRSGHWEEEIEAFLYPPHPGRKGRRKGGRGENPSGSQPGKRGWERERLFFPTSWTRKKREKGGGWGCSLNDEGGPRKRGRKKM